MFASGTLGHRALCLIALKLDVSWGTRRIDLSVKVADKQSIRSLVGCCVILHKAKSAIPLI